MMDLVKPYYRMIMYVLRTVTGEEQIKTWTFHKGLLRLLGMDWVHPKAKISAQRVLWLLAYPVFYIFLLFTITVLTMKYIMEKEHSTMLQYTRAMNGVVASITFLYSASKGLNMLLFGKKLRVLMEMVDELGEVDTLGTTQRDSSVRNSFLYLNLLLTNCFSWTGCSILYLHDIPFPTDWPWGDYTPVRYFFSFFVDGVAAVYCATLHSTYDTIFPVCVGTICGHIDSMSAKLRTLGTTNDRERDRRVLRECYRLHVSLIRVTNRINEIFGMAFLIQCIYTVIHACTIIYQVMQVSNITVAVLNSAPMLSSSYAQFLLFCYYGELLTTYVRYHVIKFDNLRFALYNNRWYKLEAREKKMLTLMSLMANRTVKLESHGITFAGHKTYVSGLQDSISYYLILKTVTTDEA